MEAKKLAETGESRLEKEKREYYERQKAIYDNATAKSKSKYGTNYIPPKKRKRK